MLPNHRSLRNKNKINKKIFVFYANYFIPHNTQLRYSNCHCHRSVHSKLKCLDEFQMRGLIYLCLCMLIFRVHDSLNFHSNIFGFA